jgi:gamma-tubulin complex component 4
LAKLCVALNQVILEPYVRTISDLEGDLLKEHHLNVTYLQTNLQNSFTILGSVCNFLTQIEQKNKHGCQILDLLYKFSISGNSLIKDTFDRLLTVCQVVMYNQMRNWMIFGILTDKYDEFFIFHDKKEDSPQKVTKKVAFSQQQDNDEDEDDFNDTGDEFNADTQKFSSKYSQYSLNGAMLPSFIQLKIANRILFTGEMLQLFQHKFNDNIFNNNNDKSLTATASKSSTSSVNNSNNLAVKSLDFERCKAQLINRFAFDFDLILLIYSIDNNKTTLNSIER